MLTAAAATIAVQVGTYAAAGAAMTPAGAAVTALLVGLLWVIIATPVFAAGAGSALDGLFRAGPVLDASAVLLIVLAAAGRLTPLGAVKIYLIWCSLGLAGCAAVLAARRAENRQIVAAAVILVAMAIAASPFWANGIILAAGGAWRDRAGYALTALNPVFATSACLPGQQGFVWNESPILYECTVLARDVPMPMPAWYVTAAAYGIVAAGLAAVTVARRRR